MPRRKAYSKCKLWYCDNTDVAAEGLCVKHYTRMLRHGNVYGRDSDTQKVIITLTRLRELYDILLKTYFEQLDGTGDWTEYANITCPHCAGKFVAKRFMHEEHCPYTQLVKIMEIF